MITTIAKRDGSVVPFDAAKIEAAIGKAAQEVRSALTFADIHSITQNVVAALPETGVTVEAVQDEVENQLVKVGETKLVRAYMVYRAEHANRRDFLADKTGTLFGIMRETDRSNANVGYNAAAKMLQFGAELSKEFAMKNLMSPKFAEAHRAGDVHIHDMDFYGFSVNCLQIPLARLLHDGFDTGHGFIRPPKRIGTAAALAAIIIQSSQNDMFGGQSVAGFDSALAPFVGDASEDAVYQAMEALVFNLNTMHSRAGAQVPFSSLNIGLDTTEAGRLVCKNLLLAYEAGLGRGEAPIFPNILFRVKAGVSRYPGDPNYDLFRLAMKVAAQRMNPTFVFCDTSYNKDVKGDIAYMGCRTRVASNVNGESICEARGNLASIALNLPRLALEAKGDLAKFWSLLDARMELCVEQLLERFELMSTFKVKDLPFVMGQNLYMGSEGLGPDDSIRPAIKNGTLTMGFIGLAETLVALTGKHHGESEESLQLGLDIMARMKARMDKAAADNGLNFSLFATPAEGLAGRFTKMDREKFGEIPGVTDREYYTNSFHVPVYYQTTHFHKIEVEGQFHKYALGGHIAYVEFQSAPVHNLVSIEKILNHMADSDVGYAGINFPIDICEDCGYQGVMETDECPVCGKYRIKRIRRITGYLSELKNFNSAKRAEAADRTTDPSAKQ